MPISNVYFVYWLILLIWQNFQEYAIMSVYDITIKVSLIIFFFYELSYAGKLKITTDKLFWYFLLCFSTIITFMNDDIYITFRTVITYFYPILYMFYIYIIGEEFEISGKEYNNFLKLVVFSDLYMSIYSFLFKSFYFTSIFSISMAYGNACSSFLVSNHEYGMYLLFGIAACLYLISENTNSKKIYYICLFVFFINLIVTYSRTSQISALSFLIVNLLLNKNKKKKIIIVIVISAIILSLISFSIKTYILDIIIRPDKNAGRFELWNYALYQWENGNWLRKLWGHGWGIQSITLIEYGHKSVHNAFLQLLLTYGICGLTLMIMPIIFSIKDSINILRINRRKGIYFLSLIIAMFFLMFSNTAILFSSPIDSFMMTSFCIVLPKFYYNNIKRLHNEAISKV